MSHGNADCTACGHEWELRKPYAEIDVVRCSECGATGDSITVTGTPTSAVTPDDLSVVERLQLEERQIELQNRAQRLMGHIEQLGDGSTPEELEPMYIALDTLAAELASDEVVAPDEFDGMAEYLDEKEHEINSHDVVTEITDLEQRVTELTTEVESLEAQKQELKRFLKYGRRLTGDE